MTLVLILIILLSIYITKSKNIKAAIKKDIEKIIQNNQHQHDKPQGEQQYHYNREISRKKPTYEPNQDKPNSQTDINTKAITTEIKTIFLNIVDALKNYYYKLKNSLKEYLKDISIENDVKDDVKHVEKPVYNVPQYNQQQYQNNDEPSEFTVKDRKMPKESSLKILCAISLMLSLTFSIVLYMGAHYSVLEYIVNSHSEGELTYYAYIYGNAYGYYMIRESIDIMSYVYMGVTLVTIASVILAINFYLERKDEESRKTLYIVVFIAIGIFLGTFIYDQLVLSEVRF